MHRAVVPVAAAVLLLAGCGSGSSGGSGLPTVGASSGTTTAPVSPTETADPTPTVDPSPWTALPTVDIGPNKGVHNGVVLASSVAKTDAEISAVEAYLAYWQYLAKVGYDVQIDQSELAKVAGGAAKDNIEAYVSGLKKKRGRTIGWNSVNVQSVEVSDIAVLLTACVDNGSYDVDAKTGRRLEKGSVAYESAAALRKVDGRLLVTSASNPSRTKPCARD